MIDVSWKDPFEEMRRMQRAIDKMFGEFFAKSSFTSKSLTESGWREPPVNMVENNGRIVVSAEMPGLNKEDIKISVTEDTLEIKAESKSLKREEGKEYKKLERTYAGFSRFMKLPVSVNPETTEATYSKGVLEINMKKTKQERKKEVEVKVK